MKRRISIIDKKNLIFRMFFGIRSFGTPFKDSEGNDNQCIYGCTKQILDIINKKKTDTIIVADDGADNFRKEIYSDYKGHRAETPEDLKRQEIIVDEMLRILGIPIIKEYRYEADDIMGTLSNIFENDDNIRAFILSSDKDIVQLVNKNVSVYDGLSKKLYTIDNAHDKFGVHRDYIVDFLSLMGDTADNIPGVTGIGPVSAKNLITQYGSIEAIYNNIDSIPKKLQTLLSNNRENAFLSKKLATIKTAVPIGNVYDLLSNSLVDMDYKTDAFMSFISRNSLTKQLGKFL